MEIYDGLYHNVQTARGCPQSKKMGAGSSCNKWLYVMWMWTAWRCVIMHTSLLMRTEGGPQDISTTHHLVQCLWVHSFWQAERTPQTLTAFEITWSGLLNWHFVIHKILQRKLKSLPVCKRETVDATAHQNITRLTHACYRLDITFNLHCSLATKTGLPD
jgi:hypothetical protein